MVKMRETNRFMAANEVLWLEYNAKTASHIQQKTPIFVLSLTNPPSAP